MTDYLDSVEKIDMGVKKIVRRKKVPESGKKCRGAEGISGAEKDADRRKKVPEGERKLLPERAW